MQKDTTDYIIPAKTVAKMNGVHISTVRRWVELGEFPKPVRVRRAGRLISGWWASAISSWQQELKRKS